jgi:Fic family protein
MFPGRRGAIAEVTSTRLTFRIRSWLDRSLSRGRRRLTSEILNNVDAMAWAIDNLTSAKAIIQSDILAIHRRLLAGTRIEEHAGRARTEQNWIGGSNYNPCSAAFVPAPPEYVEELLDDLCAFCNSNDLPAIAQAAVAHAQFETIHPFVDGNGRTGRALIHVVLRRRALVPHVLPPVSLVLATWSRDYIDALTAARYSGSPRGRAAHDGLNRWIALFAAATRRAVDDAELYEQRARELAARWRARVGRIRAGSAVDLLIDLLTGSPIVTVQSAAALIDRSEQAINEAIARLVAAGVLAQITVGRRNRAFEARELVDAFADLERMLANPRGTSTLSEATSTVARRRET